MVYLNNDFYSTMVGNQKKGNSYELKEQILGKIADLIAFHKSEVIEALNASGVLIKENASDQRVIDALIKNVENNKKLQAGLGYLITAKESDKEQNSGQDGSAGSGGGFLSGLFGGTGGGAGASGALEGAAGGAGAGPIGAIVGAVAGAVGAVFNFKAAKTNAQAEADKQRLELAQMVIARKGGSSNTGLYVGLGLLAVAAIVVIVVMKRKK